MNFKRFVLSKHVFGGDPFNLQLRWTAEYPFTLAGLRTWIARVGSKVLEVKRFTRPGTASSGPLQHNPWWTGSACRDLGQHSMQAQRSRRQTDICSPDLSICNTVTVILHLHNLCKHVYILELDVRRRLLWNNHSIYQFCTGNTCVHMCDTTARKNGSHGRRHWKRWRCPGHFCSTFQLVFTPIND
jgi:hypothetical protein